MTSPGVFKVLKGFRRRDPPPGSTLEVPLLDEERFVGVFDRMFVLADRSGEGLKPRRSPGKMFNQTEEEATVEAVKACLINIEEFEGLWTTAGSLPYSILHES